MPAFEVSSAPLRKSKADVVAVAAFASPDLADHDPASGPPPAPTLAAGADELSDALGSDLRAELAALRFDGSLGSVARVPTRGAIRPATVLVVGLGPEQGFDLDRVRRAGAALAEATAGLERLAATVPFLDGDGDSAATAQALVEGICLGAYRFTSHKSEQDGGKHRLESVTLHAAGSAKPRALRSGVRTGETIAEAVALVRDLVNEPAADKRPAALAERAKAVCKGTDVRVKVMDEQALEKGGYGGLLGVGAGSTEPPRLVELRYSPSGAKTHVALVGKGITFDSGGLSLKPSSGMVTMKMDMAGAATVLGVVRAAAALGLKVEITGLLALAENMPSGAAIRPGDVLTIRGGTTVEVLNTDAEGRLVLADALAHASEQKPDAIVDLATLTGAVLTALGSKIGGLMSTDDELAGALLDASGRSGERLWRLPLPGDLYGDELEGDVGDIKNAGWRDAGTVRAGLFLQRFVGDGIPWAHLDIAGVAWTDTAEGYQRKGATGQPARTLLEWLRGV